MIENLNQNQQKQLGYFKALELTNASNKTKLITVSPKFNQTITQLVRNLIANKSVKIGNELFDISDPQVYAIVENGNRLFRNWINGLSNGAEIQKLSKLICVEFKPWIFDGLVCLMMNVPEYSEEIVEKINFTFLEV